MIIDSLSSTVAIPINGPWTLKKIAFTNGEVSDVDIAWAKIDFEKFKRDLVNLNLEEAETKFSVYKGPLDDAVDSAMPHGYAAMNRVIHFNALGRQHLERDCSFEIAMEFKGSRPWDGLCVFSIPNHKGHDYYKGASGAPILDPTGKIVAVLVEGCQRKNELYGYPMCGVTQLIRIASEVERREIPEGSDNSMHD